MLIIVYLLEPFCVPSYVFCCMYSLYTMATSCGCNKYVDVFSAQAILSHVQDILHLIEHFLSDQLHSVQADQCPTAYQETPSSGRLTLLQRIYCRGFDLHPGPPRPPPIPNPAKAPPGPATPGPLPAMLGPSPGPLIGLFLL